MRSILPIHGAIPPSPAMGARILLLVVFAAWTAVHDAAEEDGAITSHLASVLVFPDRAEVCRQAEVELRAGRNQVTVLGLPVGLDEQTLRCAVAGSAPARVVDFQSQRYRSQRNLRRELAALDREHGQLQARVREVEDRIVALRRRGGLLGDYRGQVLERICHELADETPALERWRRALAFLAEQSHDGRSAIRAAEVELFEYRRAIAANRERVTQLDATDDRPEARRVRLWIDVEKDGERTIELRYLVRRGIRWNMHYDLRLDRDANIIEITALVAVAQETEEDWRGAALSFSTRRPAHGLHPPPLPSLRLAAVDAPEDAPSVLVPQGAAIVDERVVTAPPDSARDGVVAIDAAYSIERPLDLDRTTQLVAPGELEIRPLGQLTDELLYHAAEPVAVAADGRPVLVPLGTWRGSADWRRECLPEVLPAVYIRADFRNPTGARLLPGPAQAYLDGRSLGSIEFPGCRADGGASCTFGIDQAVLVQRTVEPVEQITDRHDDGATAISWRYAITTQFRHTGADARTVLVHEAIPVSEAEHIEIIIDPATTPPDERHPQHLGWQVTLPPGDEQSVDLIFTVRMRMPEEP